LFKVSKVRKRKDLVIKERYYFSQYLCIEDFVMLQSKGFKRTFKHNLLLAILFAFAAGIVNVFGFVNFGIFTTNITGHIGEFALWFEQSKWAAVQKITLWITAFGFGSFTSSVIIGFFEKRKPKLSYTLPVIIEIGLLLWCLLIQKYPDQQARQILILLYAMGLQNGIVSVVSGKVVRTTHLTGMVTDVGIGLGKVVLRKGNKVFVLRSLILNLAVITSFILGAMLSALVTMDYHEKVLLIPIILLVLILIFDFRTIEKGMNKMKQLRERFT